MSRAHSFPRAAEFRADPRNFAPTAEFWVFSAVLSRGIRLFTSEFRGFDAFHSNNYFFTENDFKVHVALLQVCL